MTWSLWHCLRRWEMGFWRDCERNGKSERYQYLTFSESKLAATDQTEVFFILQTATISFLYDKFPSNDHQKSTPLPHADLQSITDNQLSFIHPQSTEKWTYWSYSVVSRNDQAQYHFFSIISSLICSYTEKIHWRWLWNGIIFGANEKEGIGPMKDARRKETVWV